MQRQSFNEPSEQGGFRVKTIPEANEASASVEWMHAALLTAWLTGVMKLG